MVVVPSNTQKTIDQIINLIYVAAWTRVLAQ
jgi:hypothetical protein